MSQKSKIEITSESDFREKVGLTEPVTLEWEEGKVVQATQDALDTLKKSMEGKEATKKRELAEEFIRANEKKDALEKLEDRLTWGLEKNLLKNPAVLAVAGTAATGVWVAVHALDKQVEKVTGEKMGFMDSIRDWLKEAATESDGFMKKVWMFLYTVFGGKDKEDESSDNKPEASDEWKEWVREGEVAYIASTKWFARMFIQPVFQKWKVFNYPDIDAVFRIEKFQDLTMGQCVALQNKYRGVSDKKDLLNDLGIQDMKVNPELLYLVIDNITRGKGRDFLNKHSGTKNNVPESVKIYDLFSQFHAKFGLAWKFESIKPSTPITGPGDVGRFLGEIGSQIDMPLMDPSALSSNKDYGSILSDLKVNTSLLTQVIAQQNEDIDKYTPEKINDLALSKQDKEVLSAVVIFWSKFKNTLIQDFSFRNSGEYAKFFDKNPVTLGDAFRFYVVLQGKEKKADMNPGQEAYVYMKLWNILGKDQSLRWEFYNQPLMKDIFSEVPEFISPEAKAMIRTLFGGVVESTIDQIGGFVLELWKTLTPEQKVIFVGTIGTSLAVLWYMGPLRYVAAWATMATITIAIGLALAAMYPDDQKIVVGDRTYTRQQAEQKIVQQVKSI